MIYCNLQQKNMHLPSVKSSVFIGRLDELKRFKKFLSRPNSFILNIHTNGDGGVGKTQLLLRMLKLCRTEYSETVITGEELIDFYHTESRSIDGIISQIINTLGSVYFPETEALLEKYHHTKDTSEPEYLLPRMVDTFKEEYREFTEDAKQNGKKIALFFDTYEIIQRIEVIQHDDKEEKKAKSREFSFWLEKGLFPILHSGNTRLVVAGRYPLEDSAKEYDVTENILSLFNGEEVNYFLIKCLEVAAFSLLEYQSFLNNYPQAEYLLEPFRYALPDGRVGIWMSEFPDNHRQELGENICQLLINKIIVKNKEELLDKLGLNRGFKL